MFNNIKKLAGHIRWQYVDFYRERFVETSDQKRLERDLRRLHDHAVRAPLRSDGKKIVIFSLRPWITMLAHEGVVAARCRQQGHEVSFFTCKQDLSFCMADHTSHPEHGVSCREHRCMIKEKWLDPRYPIHSLGPMSEEAARECRRIDGLTLDQCLPYTWRSFPLGELCATSMSWYLRRAKHVESDLDQWRSFLKNAVHVLDRFEPFIEQSNPDVVMFANGAFFTEAVALECCRRRRIRTVTYGITFMMRCAAGQNKYVWQSMSEDRVDLPAMVLAPRLMRQARSLLTAWRKSGGYQGYVLWRGRDDAAAETERVLAADQRPFAVLFTNTTYESGILTKKRIFNSQYEWTMTVVDYFRRHPEYRLIIRVHPAENVVKDEFLVREFYLERMKEYIDTWPENVTIVPAASHASSYLLSDASNVALTFISTIAMELVHRGVPVITAGSCHYDGRGFTTDPMTESDYIEALDRHLREKRGVTPAHHEALVKYVAWLFFVRLIAFEPIECGERESYLRSRKMKPRQVFSGKLQGCEALCNLVLHGREWWSREEMIKTGACRNP